MTHAHIIPLCRLFLTKINSRFSKCKVFIALLTKAFYNSYPCLKEIYEAIICKRNKILIIPVRCEEDLPREDEQWPDCTEEDALMLQTVQGMLGVMNCEPPRGTVSKAHIFIICVLIKDIDIMFLK